MHFCESKSDKERHWTDFCIDALTHFDATVLDGHRSILVVDGNQNPILEEWRVSHWVLHRYHRQSFFLPSVLLASYHQPIIHGP